MRIRSDQEGGSRLAVVFWLAVLGIALHAGLKLVPLYMDYARMKDEMAVKAAVAQVLKDEEIVRDLVNKAKDLDLPLGPENFHIQRDNDRRKMRISTAWDVEVHFLGGLYVRTFHFQPEVEESFMSFLR